MIKLIITYNYYFSDHILPFKYMRQNCKISVINIMAFFSLLCFWSRSSYHCVDIFVFSGQCVACPIGLLIPLGPGCWLGAPTLNRLLHALVLAIHFAILMTLWFGHQRIFWAPQLFSQMSFFVMIEGLPSYLRTSDKST